MVKKLFLVLLLIVVFIILFLIGVKVVGDASIVDKHGMIYIPSNNEYLNNTTN